ncbi:MAG: DNA helicase RecQ [Planctomycetaceae bacterium]
MNLATTSPPAADIELLRDVMRRYWGYENFRPLQLEAMLATMSAQDSLVVLPTGGGKSLCYQVPAMCLDGTAIIVSPLISLMKDQVDAARACGIPAAFLNSTQLAPERRDVMSDLRMGNIKLLYVAPERLTADGLLPELQGIPLSFFAIDEAHCVSQWGHDFRPHYRELYQLKELFSGVGIHAFTATATEHVRNDVIQQLRLEQPRVLVGNFDRPNLTYRADRKTDVIGQIQEVIDRHPNESGIVYAITRKEVERIAQYLNASGRTARPYHAGLSDEERQENQEAFIEDRVTTIVATVAFGMGIDKPDVRYVIHAGMPQSVEHYQQESGRAGRDGLEAECCLFYNAGDMASWRRILSDQPPDVLKHSLHSLDRIAQYCEGVSCRHRMLVQHFGQTLDADCGHACDFCLDEKEMVSDPLVTSQKILSSVFRQEQRFGADYTALVLKGSKDKRIIENGHDRLSTYGLLSTEEKGTILDWVGQLVQQGFLRKVGEYNVLQITAEGGAVLKGDVTPRLMAPRKVASSVGMTSSTRTRGSSSNKGEPTSWEGVDGPLFEVLKKLRTSKAVELNLPPYIVFGDAALRDMARRRPTTLQNFRLVNGVGKKKLDDFGDEFTEVIRAYCEQHQVTTDVEIGPTTDDPPRPAVPRESGGSPRPASTALANFPLFEQGLSVAEVAEKKGLKESTVWGHLRSYVDFANITDPTPWVLPEVAARVEEAILEVGAERLKPIFIKLNDDVPESEWVRYDAISIVLTCWNNRQS